MDGVQSIDRALSIVQALAEGGNCGLRLTSIAETVGLTKSTTHRLLQALSDSGVVDQDEQSGLYFLGYNLFCWGLAAGNRVGFTDLAWRSMQVLAERTGDTVYLSVRDRYEAVCVARREGSFPIRTLTLNVGDRRPLGVGAGSLAILAFLSEAEQREIIGTNANARASYPGFDESTVWNLIEDTKRSGIAVNDSLIIKGMSAIAVPIRDGNTVVGAISVAGITERLAQPKRQNIITWLKVEAEKIESLLRPIGRNGDIVQRAVTRRH